MKTLDYSKGSVPLYVQIYQDLKEKINNKTYEYGQNIPTEFELQEAYGVSRITVRQAIQALEQEGLVIRARGKGTVVAKQEKITELLTSIKSFTEEIRDRNMVPGTKFAQVSKVEADEKLADVFSCPVGAPLYRVKRVRTANGKAIVLFDTYLSVEGELPMDDRLYYDSLYGLLEQQGIPQPVGLEEQFEAMVADEAIGEALNIPVGAPVMKRVRTAFNEDLRVQEYTISYYDGAHYTYVIYAGTKEKHST